MKLFRKSPAHILSLAIAVVTLAAFTPNVVHADNPDAGQSSHRPRSARTTTRHRKRVNFVAPQGDVPAPVRAQDCQPATNQENNRDTFFSDYYGADPKRS